METGNTIHLWGGTANFSNLIIFIWGWGVQNKFITSSWDTHQIKNFQEGRQKKLYSMCGVDIFQQI